MRSIQFRGEIMRSIRQLSLVCLPAALIVTGMPLASTTRAEVTFQWAAVGDAGNAGDVQAPGHVRLGRLPYRISKYEVTYAQYTEFLNAKDPTGANTLELYRQRHEYLRDRQQRRARRGTPVRSHAWLRQQPVRFVSWYDSIRFANWLHNGQGNGDTETGAYTLDRRHAHAHQRRQHHPQPRCECLPPERERVVQGRLLQGRRDQRRVLGLLHPTDAVPSPMSRRERWRPTNSANYSTTTASPTATTTAALAPGTAATDVGAYAASVSAYGTLRPDRQRGGVERIIHRVVSRASRRSL